MPWPATKTPSSGWPGACAWLPCWSSFPPMRIRWLCSRTREAGLPNWPLPLPQPQWYNPTDGLLTVRALIDFLAAAPTALGSETQPVLAELREYERVLFKTAQRGLRWHVAVSWRLGPSRRRFFLSGSKNVSHAAGFARPRRAAFPRCAHSRDPCDRRGPGWILHRPPARPAPAKPRPAGPSTSRPPPRAWPGRARSPCCHPP